MNRSQAHQEALSIAQQAVSILAKWVGIVPAIDPFAPRTKAVDVVSKLLGWPATIEQSGSEDLIKPLRVLFDAVNLSNRSDSDRPIQNYWPASYLKDREVYPPVPYPQTDRAAIATLKEPIREAIAALTAEDWQNFSLLLLILEKFGSHVSFGADDNVSLIDFTRTTAAVAAALADHPDASQLSLVNGDLSGIQTFIYTISSDGALKSLRARSFYLELVTTEVVEQLIEVLDVPRTNVIYAGGGNLYILASGSNPEEINVKISQVRSRFNHWLRKMFQGKIFLALGYVTFPTEAIASAEFAQYWEKATKQLARQKLQKFNSQLSDVLEIKHAYDPCRVCHRDDLPSLKPLNKNEPDSSLACWTCRTMFDLGSKLFEVQAIARSKKSNIKGAVDRINFGGTYYYLFETIQKARKVVENASYFLINDWAIEDYRQTNSNLMLLGNYGCRIQDEEENNQETFIHSRRMADVSQGIKRFACLRMDVDRLGQIFAKGLGKDQTLPRLAGLSRQMSYFFKVYLNSLAANRSQNLPVNTQCLSTGDRQNLLFIYAGGDDLFITGSWNEIVEFSFDIYQAFRAYTGYNKDITLSGGISIHTPKFPLYLAASHSGEAEHSAKGNGRDSLGLFGQVFKWYEWLGSDLLKSTSSEIQDYLKQEAIPELFGIFPLVKKLHDQKIELSYARSFIRNLLNTANLQDQLIKEFEDRHDQKTQYPNTVNNIRYDIRCYLHLPRIAYTLTRLPKEIRDRDEFKPVRTSLKNPRNSPYFKAIATWLELLNRNA